jgi:Cd2+/Zn2+-exporting ATPase
MSTATLTKKELFVQGSLTTDVAEMIEMLAVNVPGVKSCNVNAVNKSLVLSIDTTKDEGAVINELSSLIKTMDSSLKLTTSRQENKNNSKAQRKSAEGDKNVSIILGGLNCAHCAEVIGQKVSDLDEVQTANLNFVNKKLNFELKNASDREVIIERVINIIDTTEPGLDIQVMESKKEKKAQDNKVEMILGGLNCAHCAEVIGQKVEALDEVEMANLNFVNKKLSFELKNGVSRNLVIDKVINIIDTTEPGLDIQVIEKSSSKGNNKKVDMTLGGLNCAHCAEVIGQKVEDLDEVEMAHLNFVNKKLSFELKDGASRKLTIDKVINIIDTTEPGLNIQVHDNRGTKELKLKLKLENLTCKQCADQIEFEANKAKGVKSATLDFGNCILDVELDGTVSRRVVTEGIATIAKNLQHCLNIQVKGISKAQNKALNEKVTKKFDKDKLDKIRLFVGVIAYAITFIQQVWGGNHGHANQDMISTVAFIAVYLVVGGDVLLKAAKNIKNGRVFDENFLITVATLGAIIIGETSEAVGVMVFYKLGVFLQGIAVGKSRKSISSLMEIRPDVANLKIGNDIEVVDPEEVEIGDIIVVKPGERVPLDGIVIEGSSMVDTSALTGESVLRSVNVEDEVLSGFINKNALLTIEVTKDFGESAVSKVLDLVENASSKKAKTENFISVFSKYYTPVVVGLAAIIAIIPPVLIDPSSKVEWYRWVLRGLTFLVVSCPCALVLSIPLTFFSGIGFASKNGVLIKGSNYLEALRYVDTVVFDKTGTLTKGVFNVTKVNAVNVSKDELMEYAAYAEANSNHPIAKSIVKAYNKNLDLGKIGEYEEIAAHGIKVNYNGKTVLAGNEKLMKANNVKYTPVSETGTVVYIAVDGKYAGDLVISDEIKADSKEAIAKLKQIGIKQTVMLTGDNKKVADAVATELKLDKVYSNLLPDEKVEKIEEIYQGRGEKEKVVFVGDGINDAPVLARADVGIAMGGLGSDAAIEAADVVIMNDEPSQIAKAIAISKKTSRIVWQNIIFALGVKVIVLVATAFGASNMWEAVFADVGVALIAVLNAMRAMRMKEEN